MHGLTLASNKMRFIVCSPGVAQLEKKWSKWT